MVSVANVQSTNYRFYLACMGYRFLYTLSDDFNGESLEDDELPRNFSHGVQRLRQHRHMDMRSRILKFKTQDILQEDDIIYCIL